MRPIAALTAAVVVVLAACGSGDSPPEPRVAAPGEVATLADGTEVVVTGALFLHDEARLCEAMLDSYPPQCGGGFVVLVDLDPGDVVGLSSPSDPSFAPVTWTDYPLTLRGVVDDGRLSVSSLGHQVIRGESGAVVTRVMPVVPSPGTVVFAMDVTNGGDTTITATFFNGQDAEVVLRDPSGAEVYRWSRGKAFDMAIRTIDLPAGGTITTLLHDDATLADRATIEAWFVADELAGAIAEGELTVDG